MVAEPLNIKVVLIGDGFVGKTSIARAFLGKEFEHEYIMTVGVDFYKKETEAYMEDLGNIKFLWMIWDISGQPHWKNVRPAFYRGAKGAFLVFDVSNRKSYENAPEWAKEFIKHAGRRPIILIGNKIDLREKKPDLCLKFEDGLKLAEKISQIVGIEVPYVETSALLNINIDEAFQKLATLISKLYLKA